MVSDVEDDDLRIAAGSILPGEQCPVGAENDPAHLRQAAESLHPAGVLGRDRRRGQRHEGSAQEPRQGAQQSPRARAAHGHGANRSPYQGLPPR